MVIGMQYGQREYQVMLIRFITEPSTIAGYIDNCLLPQIDDLAGCNIVDMQINSTNQEGNTEQA